MTAGSLEKVSILLVDDSLHIRRLMRTMLRAMGAQRLYEAKDGKSAIEIIYRTPIDLVLVDWMLDNDPSRTGMDVVWEIRHSQIERISFLPIIMMTGHTEKYNIEKARDMGVTEFLAKPFTASTLHQRLCTLIENPRPFVRTRTYFGPDRRRHDAESRDKREERRYMVMRKEKQKGDDL